MGNSPRCRNLASVAHLCAGALVLKDFLLARTINRMTAYTISDYAPMLKTSRDMQHFWMFKNY
jgi:hypothetical protein